MGRWNKYKFGQANYGNNKYGNVKIECDGIKFDSKREMNYYLELKWKEKYGLIRDLKLQVPFLLQEAFRYNGQAIRKVEYIVDFMYYDVEKKQNVVVDVKGMPTDTYLLKRKLFLYKYGKDYFFDEVH